MSEYQYYEFQAIDRPLSSKEMNELRGYSTRARITSTSFVNEYHFGSFKGDEDSWMDKYFDAFLYLANWGTHIVKLRIPTRLLPLEIARKYCGGDSCEVREAAGNVIVSVTSEQEPEYDEWAEDNGLLSHMIAVRSELMRGDLRALYLFWLLRVQTEELRDDAVEPSVPPGLKQQTASLQALCEFLRIDEDLLHVAAESSPPMNVANVDSTAVLNWLRAQPQSEKDDVLANALVGGSSSAIDELLQKFLKHRDAGSTNHSQAVKRTVGQLRKMAESRTVERERVEAEKNAQEQARKEKEAAAARQRHLASLVGREAHLWDKVEKLIETKQPKSYDLAIQHLVDLKDLAERGTTNDFKRRVESLRGQHARKQSFVDRLVKASL